MFRQTKKRIASRRNFYESSYENDKGGYNNDIILSGNNNIDEEKQLYAQIYSNKLTFYDKPPQGEITLEQFEIWAIDRLKILLKIESYVSTNTSFLNDLENMMKPQLIKQLPINNDNFLDRKKDYHSHFILRLCFCRSKELREQFVKTETLLFKIRFNMLSSIDQSRFVQSLNLPLLQFITEEEKNSLKKELYQTVSPLIQFQLNLNDEQQRQHYFQQERFIKLPFENVIEMVGSHQVFLKDGFAYLPQFLQLNLIASEFSSKLNDELLKAFQYLPRLNEDDRLLPILNHLASGYTISDFEKNTNQFGNSGDDDINAESVWTTEISKHYPLSVKNLFRGLKENHHLKYNGRQQLSLFLKGIGLSVEEAIKFWSRAFTEGGHMTMDKFNKEYLYNFRHNYGLEGNRINYKPWSCKTILSKPRPGRSEYHGCPFRDWSPDKLTSELVKMNLTKNQIASVLDSCEEGNYIIANTKVFNYTHKILDDDNNINNQEIIDHPNLYFDRSRMLEKREKELKTTSNK